MNGSEKKKMIFAGVLFPVALGYLYLSLGPSSSSGSAAPSSDPASKRQSAIKSLTSGDSTPASSAEPSKKQMRWSDKIDPSIRLDLLEKLKAVKYEGSDRNIFQFYTPPVVIPKLAQTPFIGPPTPPPPRVADAPPPPKPIPLKFYGLATPPGISPRKAFLQNGDEIFIAAEGDMVDKQYKVIRITDTSVEMEDTKQNNYRQRLPLQEQG